MYFKKWILKITRSEYFKITLNISQIIIAIFAVFGFFFSVVPGNHLSTLEGLVDQKELRITQLDNKESELKNEINDKQAELNQLEMEIANRDKDLHTDISMLDYFLRIDFSRELLKWKSHIEELLGKILIKMPYTKDNVDIYIENVNSITLVHIYRDYLEKYKNVAVLSFSGAGPIFDDIRKSFLRFLEQPPEALWSSCTIYRASNLKVYLKKDRYLEKFPLKGIDVSKPIPINKIRDVKQVCLSNIYNNMIDAWLDKRSQEKGPWIYGGSKKQ